MTFRTARRLAGVVALVAAALAIYLSIRGSSRPNAFLNQSCATLAAIGVSVVCALCAARIFLLPDSASARFQFIIEKWRSLTPLQGHRGLCFVVAILALGLHSELARQQRPYKNVQYVDDEVDYLRVSKEIQSLPGGVAGLLPALYRGEFAEDNRHPLYPALLAAGEQVKLGDRSLLLVPTDLSKAFGLFVVLATTIIGWKLFGPAVGALSGLLLAFNGAMIQSSSLIACETQLVLLTTIAWRWAAELLESQPAGVDGDEPTKATARVPVLLAIVVGLFFGLAYLTKASAAFPLFILLALLLLGRDRRGFSSRGAAALVLCCFIVVASPLLVRNAVRYHNPVHSFNNKLLFAESYEAGIAEPDLGAVGNLRRFLDRHTVKEIVVDRFLGGIAWEAFVLLRSLGPSPFDSGRAIFGAFVMGFAAIGLWTESGRRLAPTFLMLWSAWFVLFFGWYQPIASGDRFLLPLAPPLTIAASLGVLSLLRAVLSPDENSP